MPFDLPEEVAVVGGPLKKYRIRTPSGAESVVKYNETDAARLGLTDADLADVPAPGTEAGEPSGKARPTARNKARTTANKAGGGGD
ncbi:hypothetical protein [Streptomyces aureoversilis]|uniref:Uncharacterized protein n=1 Tax=Streptomyces aureoversilis TaxID=67277 RepID=A0ABV9ZSA9_9ACTN